MQKKLLTQKRLCVRFFLLFHIVCCNNWPMVTAWWEPHHMVYVPFVTNISILPISWCHYDFVCNFFLSLLFHIPSHRNFHSYFMTSGHRCKQPQKILQINSRNVRTSHCTLQLHNSNLKSQDNSAHSVWTPMVYWGSLSVCIEEYAFYRYPYHWRFSFISVGFVVVVGILAFGLKDWGSRSHAQP